MSNTYMTNYKAPDLFRALLSKGFISKEQQPALEQFATEQQLARELPLYLRVLAGIGALIATFFFMGFLSEAKLIDFTSQGELMLWGVSLMGGAILFAKGSGNIADTIKHSFLMQISFCSMGVGKILFVSGVALSFKGNEEWGVTLATALVTLATYHTYRMSIDRYLSSLAVFASVFFSLFHSPDINAHDLFLDIFFIVQLACVAVLMAYGKIKRVYTPLAYALLSSLCLMVTFFAANSKVGHWGLQHDFDTTVMSVALSATMVMFIGWAAGGMAKLKSEPLLLASFAVAALGFISAPGILLALGLMALGYAKHERLLLITGGLVLPAFLFFYYNNLDLDLMTKSGFLVASGALLLVGRGYMHFRGFDREA